MPGLTNVTNATLSSINTIANSSSMPEFFIRVDQVVFGGIFVFILLLLLWFILFVVANTQKDQILNNAMYAGAVCAILSIIGRVITIDIDGTATPFIPDHLMWIFPVATCILAFIIWTIKE